MEQKELIDSCMRQAEYFATSFRRRTEVEWKTILAVWALLVAAIRWAKFQSVPSWVLAVFVMAFAFLWLRPLWVANRFDKKMGRYFRDEAQRLLSNPSSNFIPPRPIREDAISKWLWFLSDWSVWFQIVSVLVLILLWSKIETHS